MQIIYTMSLKTSLASLVSPTSNIRNSNSISSNSIRLSILTLHYIKQGCSGSFLFILLHNFRFRKPFSFVKLYHNHLLRKCSYYSVFSINCHHFSWFKAELKLVIQEQKKNKIFWVLRFLLFERKFDIKISIWISIQIMPSSNFTWSSFNMTGPSYFRNELDAKWLRFGVGMF